MHIGLFEKNEKSHSNILMNTTGNTVTMGLLIGNSLIKQFKTHERFKKRMIRQVIIMYFNPSSSIFITHFFIYLSQIADRSL